jgi:hypothetical protein
VEVLLFAVMESQKEVKYVMMVILRMQVLVMRAVVDIPLVVMVLPNHQMVREELKPVMMEIPTMLIAVLRPVLLRHVEMVMSMVQKYVINELKILIR